MCKSVLRILLALLSLIKLPVYSQLREQVNNVSMVVSSFGTDRAASMASSWTENSTDKDGLLLKHPPTVSAVSGVRIATLNLLTCYLITIACGRLSPVTN